MEWNCNVTITNLSLQALGTFSSSSFLERDIKRFLVPWGKKFLLNIKYKSMNISLKTNLSFKNVTIWTNSHVCQWLYLWHLLLKNIVLAIIFNHCSNYFLLSYLNKMLLSKYLWTLYVIERGMKASKFAPHQNKWSLDLPKIFFFPIRSFSAISCLHNFRSVFSPHKWFGGLLYHPPTITTRQSYKLCIIYYSVLNSMIPKYSFSL